MALVGVNVECYSGVRTDSGFTSGVYDRLLWSENVTTAGTSATAVPDAGGFLTATSAVDAWVAIGATPNASVAGRRRFLPAGVSRDFAATAGDKLAWIAA